MRFVGAWAVLACLMSCVASSHVVAQCTPAAFRVVIDVGHTSMSPGAISARGRAEHEFNLELARRVERSLRSAGFALVVSVARSGPENLAKRVAAINSLHPDLVLSVHHDSVQGRYLDRWELGGRERSFSDRFLGWSLFVSLANA